MKLWMLCAVSALVAAFTVYLLTPPPTARCEVYAAFHREVVSELFRDLGPSRIESHTISGDHELAALAPVLLFETESAGARPAFVSHATLVLAYGGDEPITDCIDAAHLERIDLPANTNLPGAVWSVSEVGFTSRNQAVLYADMQCGGLCGHGGVYLFERRDRTWSYVGYSEVWIA